MARANNNGNGHRRRLPARTPEAREQELAGAAYDLAEQQIREGTASSQVLTHFLKMGSTREALEQERMVHEIELTKVKIEAAEGQQRIEELFIDAIAAMRGYQGQPALEEGEG